MCSLLFCLTGQQKSLWSWSRANHAIPLQIWVNWIPTTHVYLFLWSAKSKATRNYINRCSYLSIGPILLVFYIIILCSYINSSDHNTKMLGSRQWSKIAWGMAFSRYPISSRVRLYYTNNWNVFVFRCYICHDFHPWWNCALDLLLQRIFYEL